MADAVEAVRECFEEIAPEAIELFRRKSAEYAVSGDPGFQMFGAAGQVADLHRKVWKLYSHTWKGAELSFEGGVEIAQDLIGHALLLIYCLRHQDSGQDPTPPVADGHTADSLDTIRIVSTGRSMYNHLSMPRLRHLAIQRGLVNPTDPRDTTLGKGYVIGLLEADDARDEEEAADPYD